jgi:hypothetical protein
MVRVRLSSGEVLSADYVFSTLSPGTRLLQPQCTHRTRRGRSHCMPGALARLLSEEAAEVVSLLRDFQYTDIAVVNLGAPSRCPSVHNALTC